MAGFKDIVGHEQIIWHLKNAVSTGKISHAYMFNGEQGSGKKLLANLFAMTLQCEEGGTEPCMKCRSCRQALTGNHPDIIRVSHEKPNTIGVEDIRGQVNGDIQIRPYNGKYKIYIISDADRMTVQAQNAILKTIEEPPGYAVLMLLANNADMMLPTILSRCVRLNLKAVKDGDIKEYLMKNMQIPDYQAEISAAFAQGNVGKAVKLASSDKFNEMKQDVLELLRYMDRMELYEIMDAVKRINAYREDMDDFLDLLTVWFRDVLLFKATLDAGSLIFKDELPAIQKRARTSSYEGLEEIIRAIDRARVRLKANVNFDLVLELLLLTIKEN
ncbi:MAG: DNA polymerase III subunit delta' [Lachnospiraceae bacterium]|nr:DNA polymerase III subunit delta' [Oscillospiraceae bacterium]MDY5541686.1 DNA polymerase III subunit delta' [Lachnospiraceae bacterium]MDY5647809.1 DNA polymerase III subunit delta' [Lachnospiraceae bacterium]